MVSLTEFTGILKVVSASQLEEFSAQGWRVLEGFNEEQDHVFLGSEPKQVEDGNSYCSTVDTRRSVVLSQRYYVLGRDETSVLADLNSKIAAANVQVKDLTAKAKEQDDTLSQARREIDRLTNFVEARDLAAGRVAQERRGEQERMRKMEKDLGKLRAALGDLKMREILGEET